MYSPGYRENDIHIGAPFFILYALVCTKTGVAAASLDYYRQLASMKQMTIGFVCMCATTHTHETMLFTDLLLLNRQSLEDCILYQYRFLAANPINK